MNSVIYLIEKLWTDSLENHPADASGYKVVGFTMSLNHAKRFVYNGGVIEGTGWPFKRGEIVPLYRYTEVREIPLWEN